MALAKEAGLNEKALEADLTASEAAAARLAEACRSAKHPLINSCRIFFLGKTLNVAHQNASVACIMLTSRMLLAHACMHLDFFLQYAFSIKSAQAGTLMSLEPAEPKHIKVQNLSK